MGWTKTGNIQIQKPGTGGPTGNWAEDSSVDDILKLWVALIEDSAVDDSIAMRLSFAEDSAVDDAFSISLATSLAEDSSVDDTLAILGALSEDGSVGDDIVLKLAFAEDGSADDQFKFDVVLAEDSGVNDSSLLALSAIKSARSGAPSADFIQDSFVRQNAPSTNFGSSTTHEVNGPGPTGTQQLLYIQVDMTKFLGVDANPSAAFGLRLSIPFNNPALVAGAVLVSIGFQASKPFVEDSVTFNTKPTELTNIANAVSRALPAGTSAQNWDLAPANLNSAMGNWLLFTFKITSLVDLSIYTAPSRESTSGSNPTIQINLRRGT